MTINWRPIDAIIRVLILLALIPLAYGVAKFVWRAWTDQHFEVDL